MNVLGFNGGGGHGIVSLESLCACGGKRIVDAADEICGTSIGAAIGGALAIGKSPQWVRQEFFGWAARVFDPALRRGLLRRVYRAKWKLDGLREVCREVFGSLKMGQTKIPLLIPITVCARLDAGDVECSEFINSWEHPEYPIADAVLQSAAAPTWFPGVFAQGRSATDGGVLMNCPILAGVAYARIREPDVRPMPLVFGTGQTPGSGFYAGDWGWLQWAMRLPELVINGPVRNSAMAVQALYGGLCVDPPVPQLPIDDPSVLETLADAAASVDYTTQRRWIERNWLP